METQEQKELLSKIQSNNNLSVTEKKKLFLILNSEKGNREIEEMLDQEWEKYVFSNDQYVRSEKMLSTIKMQIGKRKLNSHATKIITRWISAVAAILVVGIILVGLQFYTIKPRISNEIGLFYEYQAQKKNPKIIGLPDGSKVMLFPGSSLIVPENFEIAQTRNAKLDGEAFFEIAPDKQHPFILDLGGLGLEVVGTSFNISNYSDDIEINVALKTGEIKLFEGRWNPDKEKVRMEAGYLASYERGKDGFTIVKTNIDRYSSWVDGVLIFRDDLMKDVFRRLERWYDVDIEVSDPSINEFLFTATIKNESLDQIIKLIEYTSPLKCRTDRDQNNKISKIYILRNN